MNKKIIFVLLAVFLLSIIPKPIKAGCEMIEGDVVESQFEVDLTGKQVGDTFTVKTSNGVVNAKVTGIDPVTGARSFTYTGEMKNAGSYDMNSASTGKEAYYDGRESDTHSGKTKNTTIGDNKFADTKIDGNGKLSGSGKTTPGTQKGEFFNRAADAVGKGADFSNASERAAFLKDGGYKPGTTEYAKRDADLKNNNNENSLRNMADKENGKSTSTVNVKIQKLPTQVCKEDPGTDICDQHAQRTAQSFPGHNGTCTSSVGSCIKSERQDYLSSYTTSSPNLSDPTIIRRDMCGPHIRQYNETLTMTQMNQMSGRIQANQQNEQNKLQALVNQFNLPTWTSKWQLESKYWNPFQEGVISPGLPVRKHMTIELDSWLDQEYSINNILTESVNIWKAAVARNRSVVRKYNGNVDIDVFNNAPNPVVKHRYLDGREWKEINSRVIECQETYELKIEPRYDITIHNRYQKVQQRDIKGATRIETYDCDPYEELVCTTKRKPWWKRDSDDDDDYEDDCHYETKYHTCCRTVPDDQHQEWPDGETQDSLPGGSIPPIYAPRVKWKYRIGVDNEYHATAYKTTPRARLRPIPNSNRDENTVKSGYGFNYSADRWRIITDYDNPQFNGQSDLVRPNKTTNIRLNRSLAANTQNFDPNVRFDSARNAPNKSSSKNSRYINERLRTNIVNSTFDRYLISRFVSPNKDDPSIMRLQRNTGTQSGISGGRITRNGSAIQMETEFESSSDPNRYYHAYWVTRGEPNLIPAYRPGPLHYIHLDYRSGSDYDVYSMNRVVIRPGFTIDAFNSGSIRVVGNMWEDSFSRPDFRKSRDFYI